MSLAVLTEAEKNRVNCHLKHGKKAMRHQKPKETTNNYRNCGMVKSWCFLKIK